MARREDIVNTIWDDLDHLSDDALMLYIWSWTNTKCGMAGVYKVARRKLVEGRLDGDRLDAALGECESEGLLNYTDGVLWNTARVKRLSGISGNLAKSIAKDLAEIEATNPIVGMFIERYGKHPELKGLLTVSKGFPDPSRNDVPKPDLKGSQEGSETLQGRGRGRGSGPGSGSDVLPEDFDSALSPAAQQCQRILQRTAEHRGAKAVTLAAVARALESHPRKDHVAIAGDVEHWLTYGNGAKRPAKDIVARFRNFLSDASDVETPSGAPRSSSPGMSAAHRLAREAEELEAQERAA